MRTIHPFPARMAPDTVATWLTDLKQGARVLDPMCGSGVVIRQSAILGHNAKGFDVDPLAVLMSKVWTRKGSHEKLLAAAEQIVLRATRQQNTSHKTLPWIRDCSETCNFIEYWFADPQRGDLAKLAIEIAASFGTKESWLGDALSLSLSRIIVTKQYGASLAWDAPHSRPHRVKDCNDFDVFTGFLKSARRLAEILDSERLSVAGSVRNGDCRNLRSLRAATMDAVVTSPPYLNAIDYLRGHKLSLVWMGYTIPYLRQIRSQSVGTERGLEASDSRLSRLEKRLDNMKLLPSRQKFIVYRYAQDASTFLAEMKRVLKPCGRLILVLGDSNVRGVMIKNSQIFSDRAESLGFRQVQEVSRPLETSRRYLPTNQTAGALANRMKVEIIQTYEAPLRA